MTFFTSQGPEEQKVYNSLFMQILGNRDFRQLHLPFAFLFVIRHPFRLKRH